MFNAALILYYQERIGLAAVQTIAETSGKVYQFGAASQILCKLNVHPQKAVKITFQFLTCVYILTDFI